MNLQIESKSVRQTFNFDLYKFKSGKIYYLGEKAAFTKYKHNGLDKTD